MMPIYLSPNPNLITQNQLIVSNGLIIWGWLLPIWLVLIKTFIGMPSSSFVLWVRIEKKNKNHKKDLCSFLAKKEEVNSCRRLYLHYVVCSRDHKHCIRVRHLDFVAITLLWWFYNLHTMFRPFVPHFVMTEMRHIREKRDEI